MWAGIEVSGRFERRVDSGERKYALSVRGEGFPHLRDRNAAQRRKPLCGLNHVGWLALAALRFSKGRVRFREDSVHGQAADEHRAGIAFEHTMINREVAALTSRSVCEGGPAGEPMKNW